MRRYSSLRSGNIGEVAINIPNIISAQVNTYIVEDRLTGNVYIFEDDFIEAIQIALTTGCMKSFDQTDEKVFKAYMKWAMSTITDPGNPIVGDYEVELYISLDYRLAALVTCVTTPLITDCDPPPEIITPVCPLA